ncbi:hypothetical protein Cflav_PD5656 [Pedosphaera parvula Ellin514]|uniref:Uncharacterized protein n=1 Tax=Pedosphaera parvula (strain Ellin514) TaxID=320771 RepID=B9XAI6_PEDPL|nr:hypothetical protein Cflav_PD5656 [Pedosphaera parvula Ellin514]
MERLDYGTFQRGKHTGETTAGFITRTRVYGFFIGLDLSISSSHAIRRS